MPTRLILTPLEYGGLNHTTHHLFVLHQPWLLFAALVQGLSYVSVWLYPLSLKADWYGSAALWKSSSVDDISYRRLLIEIGNCLIMWVGG